MTTLKPIPILDEPAPPPGAAPASPAMAEPRRTPPNSIPTATLASTPASTPDHGPDHAPAAPGRWSVKASFWMLQASHTVIDIFPMFVASLAITLNDRLHLTPAQYAAMFAVGPVVSGLPQVFFAWASDKFDSRFCAWFGLLLGSVCLCSLGFAQNFWQLIALQVLGMIGTGMYHPISAALAGQLAGGALKHGRSWGVSIFYAAGMLGGITGPLICTRMTTQWGMTSLAWLIIPAALVAVALFSATARVRHRQAGHRDLHASLSQHEMRRRWGAVMLLFIANILRFIVNTGVVVLFGYWARAQYPTDVHAATNLTGNLISFLSVGMMAFGLLGGRLIKPGRERGALILCSLIGAPLVALTAMAGDHLGLWAIYAASSLSALGFAAIIPCTISLAQRLLPGHTGLASGLMLGTSWSFAAVAPWIASWMLAFVPLNDIATLPTWRIDAAFGGFGLLLVLAAGLSALLPAALLREVAKH